MRHPSDTMIKETNLAQMKGHPHHKFAFQKIHLLKHSLQCILDSAFVDNRMSKKMMKLDYKSVSDKIKIAVIIIGAVVSLAQNYNDLTKLFFSSILSTTALCVVIISILDKFYDGIISNIDEKHKEHNTLLKSMERHISSVEERLKVNFEYHGLIDSPKDQFSAIEMAEKWKMVIITIRSDFVGVNYLSNASWLRNRGDELTRYLGSKMEIDKLKCRRVFVIDKEEELDSWKNTLKTHLDFSIPVKYLLKSEYDKIRSEHAKINSVLRNTNGFNILDREFPGIVVDWLYKNDRSTDGAYIKRGADMSKIYYILFEDIWENARPIPENCRKN